MLPSGLHTESVNRCYWSTCHVSLFPFLACASEYMLPKSKCAENGIEMGPGDKGIVPAGRATQLLKIELEKWTDMFQGMCFLVPEASC